MIAYVDRPDSARPTRSTLVQTRRVFLSPPRQWNETRFYPPAGLDWVTPCADSTVIDGMTSRLGIVWWTTAEPSALSPGQWLRCCTPPSFGSLSCFCPVWHSDGRLWWMTRGGSIQFTRKETVFPGGFRRPSRPDGDGSDPGSDDIGGNRLVRQKTWPTIHLDPVHESRHYHPPDDRRNETPTRPYPPASRLRSDHVRLLHASARPLFSRHRPPAASLPPSPTASFHSSHPDHTRWRSHEAHERIDPTSRRREFDRNGIDRTRCARWVYN